MRAEAKTNESKINRLELSGCVRNAVRKYNEKYGWPQLNGDRCDHRDSAQVSKATLLAKLNIFHRKDGFVQAQKFHNTFTLKCLPSAKEALDELMQIQGSSLKHHIFRELFGIQDSGKHVRDLSSLSTKNLNHFASILGDDACEKFKQNFNTIEASPASNYAFDKAIYQTLKQIRDDIEKQDKSIPQGYLAGFRPVLGKGL